MRRGMPLMLPLILFAFSVHAQGVLGDLLSGDLVSPKPGVWAWYDLKDAASGKAFVVRMAIVGEEKVGARTGYWFELEIVPLVGYRSVYKMLLTGPAKDPANIHKMIIREGLKEPQELDIGKGGSSSETAETEPARKLVAKEQVETATGVIVEAEHYELVAPDGKTDLWLNSEIRPMGLVKLKSAEGELTLRKNGIGGQDARSVINEPPVIGGPGEDVKVEVRVEKQPKREPDKAPQGGKPMPKSGSNAPAEPAPSDEAEKG